MAPSLAAHITLVALWRLALTRSTSSELVDLSRWTILHYGRQSGRCYCGVLATNSSTIGGFEWALGNLWALAAMSPFVHASTHSTPNPNEPSCPISTCSPHRNRRPPSTPTKAPSVMRPVNAIVLHDLRAALTVAGRSDQANLAPPWHQLDIVAETGSTNEDLLAHLAAGEVIDGTVLVAEFQHAGRGRYGRSWSAPSPIADRNVSRRWRERCAGRSMGCSPCDRRRCGRRRTQSVRGPGRSQMAQ